MLAFGAPFFSGVGEGVGVGCEVSVGLGVAVSSGVLIAEGDGDSPGAGVADFFLCFDFVGGVGLGDEVGDVFFRLGEALGDGLGVDFIATCLRCFRVGVGVGVASRIFLIFVPNDSSAASGTTIVPKKIAPLKRTRSIFESREAKSVGEFLEDGFV
jgi:hypothetical protein